MQHLDDHPPRPGARAWAARQLRDFAFLVGLAAMAFRGGRIR